MATTTTEDVDTVFCDGCDEVVLYPETVDRDGLILCRTCV